MLESPAQWKKIKKAQTITDNNKREQFWKVDLLSSFFLYFSQITLLILHHIRLSPLKTFAVFFPQFYNIWRQLTTYHHLSPRRFYHNERKKDEKLGHGKAPQAKRVDNLRSDGGESSVHHLTCRKYFQQADLVLGPASDALDGHRCASGSHHRIDYRLQMGGSLIWISWLHGDRSSSR